MAGDFNVSAPEPGKKSDTQVSEIHLKESTPSVLIKELQIKEPVKEEISKVKSSEIPQEEIKKIDETLKTLEEPKHGDIVQGQSTVRKSELEALYHQASSQVRSGSINEGSINPVIAELEEKL